MFSLRNMDIGDYTNKLKKAMIVTLALSSLSFQHTVSAEEKTDIKTIYHVYKNKQYLGNLSTDDKKSLDQHLALKMEEVKKTYSTHELEIDQDVTFIPEQVFQDTELSVNILDTLKKDIQVEANAQAIVMDGRQVVYLPTKEAADQLLRKFKLQFVTEEELAEYELSAQSTETALTTPGTRVKNIQLSKEVQIVESSVLPNLITDEQAALHFLNSGTHEVKTYTVKEGDVLGSIASAYQLTTKELITLNPGLNEDSVLKIGQVLNVKTTKPALEVSVEREIFKHDVVPYEVKVQETDSLPKGETKLKQQGKDGKKSTYYVEKTTNGKQVSQNILSETVVAQAVPEVRLKGTKETPSRGSGQLTWPTVGGYVSSNTGYRWGKMHKGIDIARPSNRTIKAADNGVVVSAGNSGGYGNKVVIDHGNGMRTVYAHLDSIGVSSGQTVAAGSKIGIMGSTGNSTGVHLHFELYVNGKLVNPLSYL